MNRWSRSALMPVAMALLPGCVITNTPGFYSGYRKLTPAQQEQVRLVPPGKPLPDTDSNLLYAVHAESLLREIQRNDTTLVYRWSPNCHSSICASLQSVQSICRGKGYQLYVVADYYDMEQISLQPKLDHPLLAINHKSYGTDYCPKYSRLFAAGLRQGQQLPDSVKYARYYLFHGSRFVRAIHDVERDLR